MLGLGWDVIMMGQRHNSQECRLSSCGYGSVCHSELALCHCQGTYSGRLRFRPCVTVTCQPPDLAIIIIIIMQQPFLQESLCVRWTDRPVAKACWAVLGRDYELLGYHF